MKIKPFLESLTNRQLQRVADATKWNPNLSSCSATGSACLLCHASGDNYTRFKHHRGAAQRQLCMDAEGRYIRLSVRHGNAFAGRRMNQMARGVLARRVLRDSPSPMVASP